MIIDNYIHTSLILDYFNIPLIINNKYTKKYSYYDNSNNRFDNKFLYLIDSKQYIFKYQRKYKQIFYV